MKSIIKNSSINKRDFIIFPLAFLYVFLMFQTHNNEQHTLEVKETSSLSLELSIDEKEASCFEIIHFDSDSNTYVRKDFFKEKTILYNFFYHQNSSPPPEVS